MAIVDFYERPNGHAPAREFITSIQDQMIQSIVDNKLEKLEEHGFGLDGEFFERIKGDLFEFRIKTPHGIVRLFFINENPTFIFVHGVLKKSRRVPQDIERAKELMAEYLDSKRK